MSEEALGAFTRFFLETCLDQVRFMESLVQPNRLRDRMLVWAEEEVRAAPLRLAFPATLASRWMPGLFPGKASYT